jgi:hypothetical protein
MQLLSGSGSPSLGDLDATPAKLGFFGLVAQWSFITYSYSSKGQPLQGHCIGMSLH